MSDHRPVWGALLRNARESHGLTLSDVGAECGVTYQSVQDWETGRSAPTPQNQARLCNLYGLTRDELFPISDN